MMFLPTAMLELLLVLTAACDGPATPTVGLDAELRAAMVATTGERGEDAAATQARRDLEVRRVMQASIAREGDAAFDELRWLGRDLDVLRGSLLRALGSSGDPRAVPWIVEQLDDPGLVDDAFQELLRFGGATPEPSATTARARALEHLVSWEPNRRRLARAVAVALECEAAIPTLVGQLPDVAAFERDQIIAALQALSGARPGDDDEAWTRWLEAELEWSAAHAAAALAALRSRDAAEVVRAVQTLSSRAYQRARWSLAIVELLAPEQPLAVRQQACLGLGRLRSVAARAALQTTAASDPSAEVRQLATAALAGL